jgi:nicotinamide phosphoribosyltransferase
MSSIILDTDSYKTSHYLQYPPGTTEVYSYLAARGGPSGFDGVIWYGITPILRKLTKPITLNDVVEAEKIFAAHGVPFNKDGWLKLIDKHGGKLPLKIRSVIEGLWYPHNTPLLTVVNTDPEFFWLTSYVETAILRVWYPTTVATQSFYCKLLLKKYMDLSCDDTDAEISFKLHDFGSRGVSSAESAAIGGSAHLVNFKGTDTVAALKFIRDTYGDDLMPGFSIPAAEHSTITSWGQDSEDLAYLNMLNQFAKPGALLAVVSDSYNLDHAVKELWGNKLKQRVIDSGATIIIRPDSGVPHEVVLNTLKNLDEAFGHTINSKGYKVLNHVRVIQGDGINYQSLRDILDVITLNGYSVTNVAFGMGGALLQQVNRDTFKFAYKCSSITVNGQQRDVFKKPVDDPSKASLAGRFSITLAGDVVAEFPENSDENYESFDHFRTVFENGNIECEESFANIVHAASAVCDHYREVVSHWKKKLHSGDL